MSTFPRPTSETGLRAANPFVISYRRRSKRSSAGASFTGSLRNHCGKFSEGLRHLRGRQKSGRDRRPRSPGNLELHRLLRHLLGNFRAAFESDRGRDRRAVARRARRARRFSRRISREPMDRARLHAGHRARLSPRETRVLQSRGSLGRCAAARVATGANERRLSFPEPDETTTERELGLRPGERRRRRGEEGAQMV